MILAVEKPQLDQVTPYIAEANRTGSVVLRGLYLDRLPSGTVDLVGSSGGVVAPTDVTAVSPREMRLTHPALAADAYQVRMRDGQGVIIDRSTARLAVMNPPNYAADTIAYPPDARYCRSSAALVTFRGSRC